MHPHFMFPHFGVRRLARLLGLAIPVLAFLVWLGYRHWQEKRQAWRARREQDEFARLLRPREDVDRL